MYNKGVKTGVIMGCRSKDLTIDCVAFADDLAIYSDSIDGAAKQIKISQLKTQVAKVGLQISFQKNEIYNEHQACAQRA